MLPIPFPKAIMLYTGPGSSDRIDPNLGHRMTKPPANHPYMRANASKAGKLAAKPQIRKLANAETKLDTKTSSKTLLTLSDRMPIATWPNVVARLKAARTRAPDVPERPRLDAKVGRMRPGTK